MSTMLNKRPGRLGDPQLELKDDPRADPRMLGLMESLGLLETLPAPVNASTSYSDLLSFLSLAEKGYDAQSDAIVASWPATKGVDREEKTIIGLDGNQILLIIHRPKKKSNGSLPGLLHIHGGGMCLNSATGPIYEAWRSDLACSGSVVVGVEFRNSAGKLGPHPFPAGLNDCASALYWMDDFRKELDISGIIITGESGGGNLSLASCLKAKQDNRLASVAGVYAQCPSISNCYVNKDDSLPSLIENDGYGGVGCELMSGLFKMYDPDGTNNSNPLTWPLHAKESDLQGLPPHFISVCELDLLRDEGIAYARMLQASGVNAGSRTINGVVHAGDISFREAMPDVYSASIRDIKGFADSVC